MTSIVKESLPTFLSEFSAFHFRVRFEAQKAVNFNSKWYFLPRFALGNALKKSPHYAYLYSEIFKPQEDAEGGVRKALLSTSRLIIRADKPFRRGFAAGEPLDLYITIVARDVSLVDDFLKFLPEWQDYNFFRESSLAYRSYQLFNPETDKYENSLRTESSRLTIDFFLRHAPYWEDLLCIRFLSPTSVKIDQVLTDEIPYSRFMNRLSRRLYELHSAYLHAGGGESKPYVYAESDNLLLAQVSMPRKPTIKDNRHYDMAGMLGQLFYRVPYDPVAAIMLAIAHWVHVGNHTISGNGQISASGGSTRLYDMWLSLLEKDRAIPLEEAERDGLIASLCAQNYVPAPYRSLHIPKSDGGFRELNIPSKLDLYLQKSLAQVLYPVVDALLIPQNYAYRKGKGAVAAIKQVEHLRRTLDDSYTIVRCDIDDFFDTIPLAALMEQLQDLTGDPLLARMVDLWMRSGTVDKKLQYRPNSLGIPQGSPLAPMLSNLYLTETDRYIARNITTEFVRYADDLLLFLPEKVHPLTCLQSLNDHLSVRKKLRLNKDFVVSDIRASFSFLGITFRSDGGREMSREKTDAVERKIATALYRDTESFSALAETIRGMSNYYQKLVSKVDLEIVDRIATEVYASYIVSHEGTQERKRIVEQLVRIGFLNQQAAATRLQTAVRKKATSIADLPKPKKVEDMLQEQRRGQLQKKEEVFDLVVDEPGAFVGISRNHVVVKKFGRIISKQPAAQIEQISIVSEGVSFSSNVTKYCRKKSIRVVFYNAVGEAYATLNGMDTILPSVMESQMELDERRSRLFIDLLVRNKIRNQGKLLRYYYKYYRKEEALERALAQAIDELKQLEAEEWCGKTLRDYRQNAMLHEAQCSRIYWQVYALLVNRAGYPFDSREHQGATDLVNQMLNYGYAILQSYVMKTIDIWQLNPNIGILHSTQDNRPALCFDLMEQYRSFVVDRSILALLSKGEEVGQNDKGLLDMQTRTRIISKINERWFASEYYRSGEKVFSEIMKLQTRDVRDFCLGKIAHLKFYTPKW